jgi:hypothetical protein
MGADRTRQAPDGGDAVGRITVEAGHAVLGSSEYVALKPPLERGMSPGLAAGLADLELAAMKAG